MIHYPNNRSGLSLIEVLVAIFVMAIGMLALLTLFPLGAFRMEQSLRSERCAQAATNARAIYSALDPIIKNDTSITKYFTQNPQGSPLPTCLPTAPYSAASTNGVFNPVNNFNPNSYAVFVDPKGAAITTTLTPNIARVVPSNIIFNSVTDYQFFSLTDEFAFDRGLGTASLFGGALGLEVNYTWAYLLQKPLSTSFTPPTSQVNQLPPPEPNSMYCTACVFYRRPLSGALETVFDASTGYTVDCNATQSQFVISSSAQGTSWMNIIKPGAWILDATVLPATSGLRPNINANFYRITDATITNAGKLQLTTQTPITGYYSPKLANTITFVPADKTGGGSLVYFEGLVEVFNYGLLK